MEDQLQRMQVDIRPDGRLDTENASIYTGFSVKTMAMMRCKGVGPKFIKKGRIFYFKEDLDEWLDCERVVSTAQVKHK